MKKEEEIYEARFQKHIDELKWLYMELYDDQEHFDELCASMKQFYDTRKKGLKVSDLTRETDPNWYKGSDILGMMMYTKMFGGNLKGVKKHLDYLCDFDYLLSVLFLFLNTYFCIYELILPYIAICVNTYFYFCTKKAGRLLCPQQTCTNQSRHNSILYW